MRRLALENTESITAIANVYYRSGAGISSRLVRQRLADLTSVRPTLRRETLIDPMETDAAWNWVPAYTDPCRQDRFFSPWRGPRGERGFTLDPQTFPRSGKMPFYFGTRKIGDPQFRGSGRSTLLIDARTDQLPEAITVQVWSQLPKQNPVEYTAAVLPGLRRSLPEPTRRIGRQFRLTSRLSSPLPANLWLTGIMSCISS